MESTLCKPSENEALEIWKKLIEQPGSYVMYEGGPAPFVYRSIWGVVRVR